MRIVPKLTHDTTVDVTFISRQGDSLIDTGAIGFKALFEAEMLVSERLRLRAMLALFSAISLAISIAVLLLPGVVAAFFGGSLSPAVVLPIAYSYLLYEIAAYIALTRAMSKNLAPSKFWGYTSALVESSIPTLITYALGTIATPSTSLFLPPLFLYFVFIALSALRLDQKLVWFAGICCSAQYFLLSYFSTGGFHLSAELPKILSAPQHHAAKALLLLLVTAATVLVVKELQKRILNSLVQAQEQQKILSIFGQHLSPQVAARLTSEEDAGESRSENVSILFFDIRGFTAFAEKREPEAVVNYLNTLFESLIEAVDRHDGFVSKFLGDGFMAVFGAAKGNEKHAHNAVSAAIEISERVKALMLAKDIDDTKIGIGIHSGTVMTGNIGSSARREFTIIGDVVNLASRLEQLTKQFGREILMSKEVADAASLEGLETEFVAEASIRGRETREKIYTATRLTLPNRESVGSGADERMSKWRGNPENVEAVSRSYRTDLEINGFSVLSERLNLKRSLALATGAIAILGLFSLLAT